MVYDKIIDIEIFRYEGETDMENRHAENAKVFRAFCDENRLQILEALRDGEKCACQLLDYLNIGQSTLSHHMKILCESGIVESRTEGKWTHYSLSESGINGAKALLAELTAQKPADGAACACEK